MVHSALLKPHIRELQRSAVLTAGANYVVRDTRGDADFDFESDFRFGTGLLSLSIMAFAESFSL